MILTKDQIAVVEAGILRAKSGPHYQLNPIVEDFLAVVQSHKELLAEHDRLVEKLREVGK